MIPYSKVESLAACRMTAQQIADVLDVDLNRLKENREAMTDFYAAIRKGRAKGEAELRAALFKLARKGMPLLCANYSGWIKIRTN